MVPAIAKVALRRSAALQALLLILSASGNAAADDHRPPTIEHQPVLAARPSRAIEIRARIVDADGVALPRLYFRKAGQTEFSGVALTSGRTKDEFIGTIPGIFVGNAGVEYYLEAFDSAGNGPAQAGSADRPYRIVVTEPAASRAAAAQEGKSHQPAPSARARAHWYKSWWFWTAVGAVVAGSVVAITVTTVGSDEGHMIRVSAPPPQPSAQK